MFRTLREGLNKTGATQITPILEDVLIELNLYRRFFYHSLIISQKKIVSLQFNATCQVLF